MIEFFIAIFGSFFLQKNGNSYEQVLEKYGYTIGIYEILLIVIAVAIYRTYFQSE
jgi:hypothetical protein